MYMCTSNQTDLELFLILFALSCQKKKLLSILYFFLIATICCYKQAICCLEIDPGKISIGSPTKKFAERCMLVW